jgi:NADH:ubiquinone oxidoreductase subunit E
MDITICMGSSCYSRGNAENLRFLEEYCAGKGKENTLHIVGSLCMEQCKKGPHITLNHTAYEGVTLPRLKALIAERKNHE